MHLVAALVATPLRKEPAHGQVIHGARRTAGRTQHRQIRAVADNALNRARAKCSVVISQRRQVAVEAAVDCDVHVAIILEGNRLERQALRQIAVDKHVQHRVFHANDDVDPLVYGNVAHINGCVRVIERAHDNSQ